jgi:hypothetical protein
MGLFLKFPALNLAKKRRQFDDGLPSFFRHAAFAYVFNAAANEVEKLRLGNDGVAACVPFIKGDDFSRYNWVVRPLNRNERCNLRRYVIRVNLPRALYAAICGSNTLLRSKYRFAANCFFSVTMSAFARYCGQSLFDFANKFALGSNSKFIQSPLTVCPHSKPDTATGHRTALKGCCPVCPGSCSPDVSRCVRCPSGCPVC